MRSSRGIKRSSELKASRELRRSAELRRSSELKRSTDQTIRSPSNLRESNVADAKVNSPPTAPPNFLPYEYAKTYPQSPLKNRMRPSSPRVSHFSVPMETVVYPKSPVLVSQKVSKKNALFLSCFPCFMDDENFGKVRPSNFFFSFTFLISLFQIIIFIASVVVGGIAPLSANFAVGPHVTTLIRFGAKVSWLIRYKQQYWRFISPLFLHSGFIHLFINLFAQTRFGTLVERDWGKRKFLAIYFVTGFGSILSSCLFQPNEISVGASGSICGLIGAYFAQIGLMWKFMGKKDRTAQLVQMVVFLVVLGLMMLTPYIDSSAHFGGFILGLFMGLGLLVDFTHPHLKKIRFVFVLLAIGYLAGGLWWFFTRVNPVFYNLFGLY